MDNEELEKWSTTLLMLELTEALKNDDQKEINRIAKPLAKRICKSSNNKDYETTLKSLGYVAPKKTKSSFVKRLTLKYSNSD